MILVSTPSPSAMARCLYILDILVLIIELLDMTNLASVALVSPYFRELALNALFKRIDCLSPLIRYLRSESGEDPWNGFTFPSVSDTAWLRFTPVAKRVQQLSFTEDSGVMCSRCLSMSSQSLDSSTVLLPHLRSFSVRCSTADGLRSIGHWLPRESLQDLDLDLDSIDEDTVATFLRRMRERCTGLSSFRFRRIPSTTHLSNEVDGLLRDRSIKSLSVPVDLLGDHTSSSSLRELTLFPATSLPHGRLSCIRHIFSHFRNLQIITFPSGYISDPVLRALSSLSCMEDLTLTTETGPLLRPRALSWTFPNLRCITLPGCFMGKHSLLRAFEPCNLETIRVTSAGPMLCFDATSMHASTLRNVEIIASGVHPVEVKALRALLTCSSLERLVVQQRRPLALNDQFIYEMLHSWPMAKHICLNPHPTSRLFRTPVMPTLRCLASIASHTKVCYFGVYLNSDATLYTSANNRSRSKDSDPFLHLDLGHPEKLCFNVPQVSTYIYNLFSRRVCLVDAKGTSHWVRRVKKRLEWMSL